MADIAWSDVVGIAAQLGVSGAVPLAGQTVILGLANDTLSANFFGGDDDFRYKMARILYAAHFGELVRRQGQLGMVTAETFAAESVSVQYMSRLVLEPMQATPYGEQFVLLQNQSPNRMFVA